MLLECSCGKMFRVRDGTTAPPTKCPSCGGTLRAAAGPAPAAPAAPPSADPRAKELEAKVAELEKAAAAARAAAEARSGELEEMAGRLAQAQKSREEAVSEGARLKAELQRRDSGTKDSSSRIQTLEKEVQEARVKAQQAGLAAIKEKDAELHYAQERIAALERELQGAQGGTRTREKDLSDARGRVSSLEAAAQVAIREKEAEHKESQEAIARLGEELKKAQDAYKTTLANKEKEIEGLHAKISTTEKQLVETSARVQGGGKLDALLEQKGADLQRAQGRISMLERIVQDGEQRYRSLQEEYQKTSETAHTATAADTRALEEKESRITDLEAAAARHKAKADELQKRLDAGSAEKEALQARLKTKEDEGGVGEARYLAADLDRNLSSLSTGLQGLIDRVKRLNQSLNKPETPAEEVPAPAGSAWGKPVAEAAAAPAPLEEDETKEEAPVELESLPEASSGTVDDGGLPQDETLLDLGGGGMGKKVREALQKKRQPPPPPEPATSAQGDEATFEEEPLSAETSPGPIPEEEPVPQPEPEKPKKQGLFGKLFGRKK